MKKKILKVFIIILFIVFIFTSICYGIFYKQAGLMEAVIDADEDQFSYWVDERGVNPNNLYGEFNLISYYLFNYIEDSDIEFVEFLLKKDVNANTPHKRFLPPIFVAIIVNRPDIVELLIKYKANVNIALRNGVLPLGLALQNKDCEMAKILIDNGATIEGDKFEEERKLTLQECEEK